MTEKPKPAKPVLTDREIKAVLDAMKIAQGGN